MQLRLGSCSSCMLVVCQATAQCKAHAKLCGRVTRAASTTVTSEALQARDSVLHSATLLRNTNVSPYILQLREAPPSPS